MTNGIVNENVNVIDELAKIQGQIDALKNATDETLSGIGIDRKTAMDALELKLKNAERAKEAAVERAKTKLFITHFINGCPCGCKHFYRAFEQEITQFLAMREASTKKL